MKLNLSPKASRNFRKSILISGVIGFILGLLVPIIFNSLINNVLIWILSPLIVSMFFMFLVLGIYMIFLQK